MTNSNMAYKSKIVKLYKYQYLFAFFGQKKKNTKILLIYFYLSQLGQKLAQNQQEKFYVNTFHA